MLFIFVSANCFRRNANLPEETSRGVLARQCGPAARGRLVLASGDRPHSRGRLCHTDYFTAGGGCATPARAA